MPERGEDKFAVVFDNTVLTNFSIVGQTDLLQRLYQDKACTTLMVVDEIQRGLEGGYAYLQPVKEAFFPLNADGWITVLPLESPQEQALYVEFSSSLGAGEASGLVLALVRSLTLATDDRAARRLATKRGIKLTGTVGILVRLVREGHLTLESGNDLLGQMIKLRYRSPVERLDDLFR